MKPKLTIEAFADWCGQKPVDEEYDYWDNAECACGQYANALGICPQTKSIFTSGFWALAQEVAGEMPRTFGALAARLRASL